ncbi:MAG: VWA domain-containing protein [Chthonomonadaceae bacterium]|nr:VWA domain-containing protein [Chthonomonadaceae bacterium]
MKLPNLSKFSALTAVALFGVVGSGLPSVKAQGIIFPDRFEERISRPLPPVRESPFYVKNLRINAVVHDSVAETVVEQTFVNDSNIEQEGTYLYPLPEGATPSAFSMTVGDKTMEPRVLTREEARSIYESIVRRRKDPALLEYVGRNLVRISVFPIPAHGERVIRMRYTETLKPENGLRRYSTTLSTARFGARPVGTSVISVRIETNSPLKNVYSPSHSINVGRPSEKTATVSWEGTNAVSDRDFSVLYSTSDDDVGLSLLTYKTGESDGYFLLLASPRISVPKSKILPKQVVFVLDKTGSMAGEKIVQARKSLLFCLNSLHPEDKFNVVTFAESAESLNQGLVFATEANVRKAKDYVSGIEASGGTNIDEGLKTGLSLLKKDGGNQKMLIFMTDGLPTLGETNVATIMKHAKEATPPNTRIFSFGLGYDVNVPFLDKLASENKGDADFIRPEEDVEAKVSAFYSKVASPVLSNLSLALEGVDAYDLYPKAYPDLFKGSQLVIAGRFRGNSTGLVRLAGMANGTKESFTIKADMASAGGRDSYLPRLWASRKIGYLIDELRLKEASAPGRQEVVDEIVRLSREFGIITEYTSFLVDEREQTALGLRGADALTSNGIYLREITKRSRAGGYSGSAAVEQSFRAKDLSASNAPASRYQSQYGDASGGFAGGFLPDGLRREDLHAYDVDWSLLIPNANYNARKASPAGPAGPPGGKGRTGRETYGLEKTSAPQVNLQAIKDRAFYRQSNNLWQDALYDAKKQKLTKIQAYSEAHFALMRNVKSLSDYSSAGESVIVKLSAKNAIEIGKTGRETLTSAEIAELTK